MSYQLPLTIQLNDESTLEDFCWGENQLLSQQIDSLLKLQGERFFYIWGNKGAGKSHLLQACVMALQSNVSAIYLPLSLLSKWGPEVLEGIESQQLICIDDIDTISGNPRWEEALFHCYNRLRDNNECHLIVSATSPIAKLGLNLPDLTSRLSWGLVFQLHELQECEKINVLMKLAKRRGFELSEGVIQFLLKRCARNMHDLQSLLNQLDEASLIAQRKITIPFVKQTLYL